MDNSTESEQGEKHIMNKIGEDITKSKRKLLENKKDHQQEQRLDTRNEIRINSENINRQTAIGSNSQIEVEQDQIRKDGIESNQTKKFDNGGNSKLNKDKEQKGNEKITIKQNSTPAMKEQDIDRDESELQNKNTLDRPLYKEVEHMLKYHEDYNKTRDSNDTAGNKDIKNVNITMANEDRELTKKTNGMALDNQYEGVTKANRYNNSKEIHQDSHRENIPEIESHRKKKRRLQKKEKRRI